MMVTEHGRDPLGQALVNEAATHLHPTGFDPSRIRRLYQKTGGKAWEPPEPNHPAVLKLIEGGYVRRCDMRCGFEAFKDSGLQWTEAGRAIAMEARRAETAKHDSVHESAAIAQTPAR